MRYLIRYVTLRHLTASPGRTLLTLLGVTLGVALVFAIDVVNGSVMASFRNSVDQMAGKAALVVGEGTRVDEELLEVVRGVEGVAVAAPAIQETVRDVEHGAQLAVLAVDTASDDKVRDYDLRDGDVKIADDIAFMNDPRGVLVTESYAKKHGLAVGATLRLETTRGQEDYTVRGTLAPRGPAKVFGGELLIMDVLAAQIAFERGRRFDRIDIVPEPNADLTDLSARISAAIGGRASVTRPEQRNQEAELLLSGFQLGLSTASLVALLVGGFIVYNALAIAVAQRRREIGILRALGATRMQVRALFVGEGVLIGAVGSALGLVLGLALGRAALATAGATVSELYMTVKPDQLTVAPLQLVTGMAVGIGASFLAALVPARRASAVEPATAMRKKVDGGDASFSSSRRALQIGAALLVVAAVMAWIAHAREDFTLGSTVAVFVSLATACFAPSLARIIASLARRLIGRQQVASRLGVLAFDRNSGRNAIAIAALGMALANVVNIACFLESMKENTARWFARSVRADILVFAGQRVQGKFERPLPGSMLSELAALPGVEFVGPLRTVRQQYQNKPYLLLAYDMRGYSRYDEIPIVEGDLETALTEIEAGRGIAASESFARQFGVQLGEELTLQTPLGLRAFRISLIYIDYSAEVGILSMARDVYMSIWKDSLVDSFGIYTKEGVAIAPLRDRIAEEYGSRHQLMALANGDYKAEVMGVFDRSFALMRSMELVAIAVALLGIVNTLVVSVLDRTVELGVLKAIGALKPQVQRMFVTEALLIGITAALLGLLGGIVFSVYTVKELLRFQLGWRIDWQSAPLAMVEALVVAQLVAVVGAWLPIRRASKLDVVQALQYE